MFKLALSPMFWAKCKVEFTGEDGRKQTGAFDVQFKRHNRNELDVVQTEIREAIASGNVSNHDSEFCRRVVNGFRDIEVTDDKGDTITAGQTQELLGYLLAAGFGVAMVSAFYAEYPKARAKN